MRTRLTTVAIVLGGVLALTAGLLASGLRRPPGPRTLPEAIAVVEARGLYWVSDEPGGIPGARVTVSDRPLTAMQARCIRLKDPQHPAWLGTVAIFTNWRANLPNYDPACSAIWGELFVYGDPRVIGDLTGP